MIHLRGAALLPSLLVGGALAVATQVAAGLLLYGGVGFLPALAVVLATAAVALALGLLAPASGELLSGEGFGPTSVRPTPRGVPGLPQGPWVGQGAVDEVRRRWLGLLLSFTAAATFTAGWEFFQGFGARGLTQGLGLALLVALPMHAAGRLVSAPGFAMPPAWDRPGGGVGSSLLLGAAFGALVLGHLLFPVLSPTALFLLCVVATSGGALVHGWLLDEVLLLDAEGGDPVGARIRWRRARPRGEGVIWVHRGADGRESFVSRGGDGEATLEEEVVVEDLLRTALPSPARVAVVGWDALPVALAGVADRAPVEVLDPCPARVSWLASEVDPDEAAPSRVDPRAEDREGGLDRWLARGGPPVDRLVLGRSVAPLRPWAAGRGWWERVARRLAPGGVVVVLGVEEGPDGGGLLEPLGAGGSVLGEGDAWVSADPGAGARRRGFLLLRKDPGASTAEPVEGVGVAPAAGAPAVEVGSTAEVDRQAATVVGATASPTGAGRGPMALPSSLGSFTRVPLSATGASSPGSEPS